MGLIDDVFKNINQGINEIQNKSQGVMQQISLNNRINSLEGRKTSLLVNLGQLVFDKYEKGDEVGEDLLKSKAKEITSIEAEIKTLREELEGIKAAEGEAPKSQKADQMAGYKTTPGFTCPHCQAPAASNKYYCVACGGSLKEATPNTNGGSGSTAGATGGTTGSTEDKAE